MRAVGKALGGTINDVGLAMCSGALRRYLMARGELPDQPLTAMVPVSLRTAGRREVGNAVPDEKDRRLPTGNPLLVTHHLFLRT